MSTENVFVGLGANLGDATASLEEAARRIRALDGVEILARSGVFRTNPQGLADQPWFHNQVLQLAVDPKNQPPEELMRRFLDIEASMGRVREIPGGPRVIDIDMLLYGERVMRTDILTLPHPLMRKRAFVLVPLYELAPNLVLPDDGLPVSRALAGIQYTVRDGEIRQNTAD